MVLTERDRKVLAFLAKWRYGTVEQLQKAGIFQCRAKKCTARLLVLRKARLIKAGRLPGGQMFYYLTACGGTAIEIPEPWYSFRYVASASTILHRLVLVDFALAAGVAFIPASEVIKRLGEADYGTLAQVARLQDAYYVQDGHLHVLVADKNLSPKYFQERVKAYAGLPAELRDTIVVVFLVFSDVKRKLVARLAAGASVRVRVLKATWKYGMFL